MCKKLRAAPANSQQRTECFQQPQSELVNRSFPAEHSDETKTLDHQHLDCSLVKVHEAEETATP